MTEDPGVAPHGEAQPSMRPKPAAAVIALLQEGARAANEGRFDAAHKLVTAALDLDESIAAAHFLLGELALQREQWPDAVERFGRALAEEPSNHLFQFKRAFARHNNGDLEDAMADYQAILADAPRHEDSLANLVSALCALERFDDAISWAFHYGETANKSALTQRNLALAYLGRNDLLAAVGAAENARQLEPGNVAIYMLLAKVYERAGRFAQSAQAARAALSLERDVGPRYRLAVAQRSAGDIEACIATLRDGLSLFPDDPKLQSTLGYALLTAGQLAKGWDYFRSRFADPSFSSTPREFPQWHWNGESLHGKTLLMWGEQGIGDEVMFACAVPDLLACAERLIVECDPRLMALYRRSFPDAEIQARQDPPAAHLSTTAIDYQAPLGDAAVFKRRIESAFPAHTGYLRADPIRVRTLRARYQSGRDGLPLVGLSWRTASPKTFSRRTLPFEDWAPVLQVTGIRFVSLQYAVTADELVQFEAASGVAPLHDREIVPLSDLDGFAAQVSAMDLVVSIDNATVHFAGALGVPVWVLLAQVADWRWQLKREDSPWYPSARLLRQDKLFEWREVALRVAAELRIRFAQCDAR